MKTTRNTESHGGDGEALVYNEDIFILFEGCECGAMDQDLAVCVRDASLLHCRFSGKRRYVTPGGGL